MTEKILATFRIEPQDWKDFQDWAKSHQSNASSELIKFIKLILSGSSYKEVGSSTTALDNLDERIEALQSNLDKKLEQRLEESQSSLKFYIDKRLDERLNSLDEKISGQDLRLDRNNQRLKEKISNLDQNLDERLEKKISCLEQRLDEKLSSIDKNVDQGLEEKINRLELHIDEINKLSTERFSVIESLNEELDRLKELLALSHKALATVLTRSTFDSHQPHENAPESEEKTENEESYQGITKAALAPIFEEKIQIDEESQVAEGITNTALAQILGVDLSTISRWRAGKTKPKTSSLAASFACWEWREDSQRWYKRSARTTPENFLVEENEQSTLEVAIAKDMPETQAAVEAMDTQEARGEGQKEENFPPHTTPFLSNNCSAPSSQKPKLMTKEEMCRAMGISKRTLDRKIEEAKKKGYNPPVIEQSGQQWQYIDDPGGSKRKFFACQQKT